MHKLILESLEIHLYRVLKWEGSLFGEVNYIYSTNYWNSHWYLCLNTLNERVYSVYRVNTHYQTMQVFDPNELSPFIEHLYKFYVRNPYSFTGENPIGSYRSKYPSNESKIFL